LFDGTIHPYLDLGDISDLGVVNRVFLTQSGQIWVLGLTGLRQYSADRIHNKELSQSFQGQNAQCLLEMENGVVWVGGNNGIYQYDGSSWTVVRKNIAARVMQKTKDGSIWVVTSNGLYRYKNQSWVQYSENEGLTDILNFTNVIEDNENTIWLSTNRGVFHYDPTADIDAPQTLLDDQRNTKKVSPDGNTLIFFDGIDKWKYTPKHRLLYSYKIDEHDWSPFQEENSVYLQNLAYGPHSFQVRTMDRNWNMDPTPERFRFAVQYPWYLQPGFILAFIVFTTILIFRFVNLEYLVRLRTKGMKQEMNKRLLLEGMVREVSEREQRRIGQDLHDGLSQLLAGTRMLARRTFNKLKADNHPEADEVKDIQTFLEQSMSFTRDMIRGLTPIALDQQSLDEALHEFAVNIQKMFDVTCNVEINCRMEIRGSMVKTNIYRIVQEAVNNAVKHGNASLITIHVGQNDNGYSVSVKDNGCGFDSSNTEGNGMGLKIMQYRASLFHGSVRFCDQTPSGVEVICEIPQAALTMES
jgi:signal transduction histidine kinase